MKITTPLLAAAVLVLSGCAVNEGVYTAFSRNCGGDVSKLTTNVDWGMARTFDIKLEQNQYSPLTINLRKGQPYVFLIKNAEKTLSSFGAREFFESIALASVKLGGKTHVNSCITAIHIAPNGVAEVRFVTMKEGQYTFANSLLFISFTPPTGGAFGVVTVD